MKRGLLEKSPIEFDLNFASSMARESQALPAGEVPASKLGETRLPAWFTNFVNPKEGQHLVKITINV